MVIKFLNPLFEFVSFNKGKYVSFNIFTYYIVKPYNFKYNGNSWIVKNKGCFRKLCCYLQKEKRG